MCAYSTINGEYACQNQYLMQTTLDQRWGFPGFVTSDYQATHSTVQSADAGMDQEMPAPQYYGSALQAAVQDRPGQHGDAGSDGAPDPERDVPLQRVQQPADRLDQRHRDHPGASGGLDRGRRGGHRAAQERSPHAAAALDRQEPDRRDRPGRLGLTDRYRRRQRVRDLDLQRHAVAGHPGRRPARYAGQLRPRASRPTPRCRRSRAATSAPAYSVDQLRRHLHRHAHRAGDRHLRAGVPEPGQLHGHVSVAGRQGDPGQPGHAAHLDLLGRGQPPGRTEVHAAR